MYLPFGKYPHHDFQQEITDDNERENFQCSLVSISTQIHDHNNDVKQNHKDRKDPKYEMFCDCQHSMLPGSVSGWTK